VSQPHAALTRPHVNINAATHPPIHPGGHYSAHVQQHDSRWLHFNDANVAPVSLNHVLAERTYVLVYQKAG